MMFLSFKERNERLNICKKCEHNFSGICKKCGCILKTKTFLANQSCPLNKWTAKVASDSSDSNKNE